jgi:hypothetical protein
MPDEAVPDQRSADTGTAFDRKASPISNTDCVPAGTLLQVPSAPATGKSGSAPVVAVNTVSKWKDPVFLLLFVTGLSTTFTAVMDVIPSAGDIDWRLTAPKIVFAILNGIGAFLRTQINSVTK